MDLSLTRSVHKRVGEVVADRHSFAGNTVGLPATVGEDNPTLELDPRLRTPELAKVSSSVFFGSLMQSFAVAGRMVFFRQLQDQGFSRGLDRQFNITPADMRHGRAEETSIEARGRRVDVVNVDTVSRHNRPPHGRL